MDRFLAALMPPGDHPVPILALANAPEELRRKARPTFCIITSDHGTAYGEDGWSGHRVAHPVVWTVPANPFSAVNASPSIRWHVDG